MTQAMAAFEKIVPEKVAMLKQKQTEAIKNLPPEIEESSAAGKNLESKFDA